MASAANNNALFTEDRANNQIHVQKAVEASLQATWDAWTQPSFLGQWWEIWMRCWRFKKALKGSISLTV